MNNELAIINHNGVFMVDSREVAEMMGRGHKEILMMIEGQKHVDGRVKHIGFLPAISESGLFNPQDFFIKSSYKVDGNNKTYPCYLLTKQGCDMTANKMSGKKGVLFTAAYVTRFVEMEKALVQPKLPALTRKDLILMALESEERAERLEIENQTLLPKAAKYDEFLDAEGLTTMTIVGKQFLGGLTAVKVARFLQEKGILYKNKIDACYVPRLGYEKYFKLTSYIKRDYTGRLNLLGRSLKLNNEGIDFTIDLFHGAPAN